MNIQLNDDADKVAWLQCLKTAGKLVKRARFDVTDLSALTAEKADFLFREYKNRCGQK